MRIVESGSSVSVESLFLGERAAGVEKVSRLKWAHIGAPNSILPLAQELNSCAEPVSGVLLPEILSSR